MKTVSIITTATSTAVKSKAIFRLMTFLTTLLAFPALANVNAIDYPAMPAGATGTTITFPSGETAPLVGLEECEQQKQADETCDNRFSLFYVGDLNAGLNSELLLKYRGPQGTLNSVPMTLGSDGVARSGSPYSGSSSSSPSIGYPTFYVRGGAAEVESLDTELGVLVQFSLGLDVPLYTVSKTQSGTAAEVGGSFEFGAEAQRLFWGINRVDADSDGGNTFSATDLGTDEVYGFLYHQRNPETDSTGISAGGLDFSVNYAAEYESTGVNLALGWDELNSRDCVWTPMVGLRYADSDYRLDTDLRFTTDGVFSEPNEISSRTRQRIEERLFGVGFGIGGHTPRGHYPLEFSYKAMVYGDWIDHDLTSLQHNICELCSSPEDSYLVDTTSENDEWGLGATLEFNLFYPVTDRTTIGLYGALDYRGYAPQLLNPVTEGDTDDGPKLATKDATNYQFGLTIGHSF